MAYDNLYMTVMTTADNLGKILRGTRHLILIRYSDSKFITQVFQCFK